MATKNVLGRGVSALLPDELDESGDGKFFLCDIDKIIVNPKQPRSSFDEKKLEDLAESIREQGIIQPLLVALGPGTRYSLIAGERRLRAARLAQLDEVPVLVVDAQTNQQALELALVENIQRQDLNPLEEAQAYARMVNEFQLSQEAIARKVGRQRSTIANLLRLLQLPEPLQEDLASGLISEGHARVLLRLKDEPQELWRALRDAIVDEDLSVRETERRCARMKTEPPQKNKHQAERPLHAQETEALVSKLQAQLKTQVRLVTKKKGGRLEINYSSTEELQRLTSLLLL